MVKSIVLKPEEIRAKGKLQFKDIELNTYATPMKEAAKHYPRGDLLRMHRDMAILREFESMLNSIKREGKYEGISYNHRGPAHLSIGQESLAVGQAYTLTPEDFSFGSHRAHSEILSRGLRSIAQLEEGALLDIMKNYFGGLTLSKVEKDATGGVRELANDFFVYGTLAEIFARETGWHKGLGGSMHAFFCPFGVYPNNAIVGGSGDIAVGAALYKRVNSRPGLVVANIGDASLACGPVWEGIVFATMDQYRTLWDKGHNGGLPLIINFVNNLYGMGGQPVGETMGLKILARLGAGVNPDQLHSERVDGFKPLAIVDAYERKRKILQEGRGPVLLDTLTYRFSGHSPSDSMSYRTKEEVDAWQAQDAIPAFADELVKAKVATPAEVEGNLKYAKELVFRAFKKAIDPVVSPYLDPGKTPVIEKLMFSGKKKLVLDSRQPEVLIPLAENPQLKRLAAKSRFGLDAAGKQLSGMKAVVLKEALFEAIIDRFYEDPTLAAWGEDNRDWGGAFAVYRGLTESIPYHRFFNSPISEGAIVGAGVGYALSGGRALVEIMYCDFLGRCGDEVFNQMAKWQSMSAGILEMPLVLRVSVGAKYGAQHSQDWSSICAHIPGLKVVFPATPYDAKGMMYTALAGTDPVVFFESQRLYDQPEIFVTEGVPAGRYEVPFGEPARRREGKDLTICTIGATIYRALEAAKTLEEKYGLTADVWDLRSLSPLNYAPLVESVKKTGYVLLSSDACERGSYLHGVASNLTSLAFDYLDAPVAVVGSKNWITPAAEQEESFFPQPFWLVDAVHQRLRPLKGHVPEGNWTDGEILRLNQAGV
ncbi:MAG: dehydrogenase [Planctomycetota bacterium]|jgi:2-oxoisovalerate dehydrogenase E1 component|nr:dehydrogenase [Planctomycetota bacterium]